MASRVVVLTDKELIALRELVLSFTKPGHATSGRVTISALVGALDALNAAQPSRLKRPVIAVSVPLARWLGARCKAMLDAGMDQGRTDRLYLRWVVKTAGRLESRRDR